MRKSLEPFAEHLLDSRLRWLQLSLPVGILVAVAAYEIIFELVFHDRVAPWLRFSLEILVFGAVGAVIVYLALMWVRRLVAADLAERERAQEEIRALNRRLESQVAQRTRELSDANAELRKRQRELERANQELKQLDQLKSEFVSLVSHELRAPLANISGSLELLLDEPNELSANQRELLTLTNDQVERLSRLVKGILNVSRIEAGQALLQPQAFDIGSLLERTVNQWQACDPTHTYRLVGEMNLPSVWADPDRVEEVLTNLLENAFKYSEEGSEITVGARVEDLRMVVAVRDRGSGIDPEELGRIFDKFYRVERSDARKTYGYGLGLYISYKLIDAMGGELWAESELGVGSTFYFSLPLAGHMPRPQETAPTTELLNV